MLLSLPPEIRFQIYHHLFHSATLCVTCHDIPPLFPTPSQTSTTTTTAKTPRYTHPHPGSILLTSRTPFLEALPLFHSTVTLTITNLTTTTLSQHCFAQFHHIALLNPLIPFELPLLRHNFTSVRSLAIDKGFVDWGDTLSLRLHQPLNTETVAHQGADTLIRNSWKMILWLNKMEEAMKAMAEDAAYGEQTSRYTCKDNLCDGNRYDYKYPYGYGYRNCSRYGSWHDYDRPLDGTVADLVVIMKFRATVFNLDSARGEMQDTVDFVVSLAACRKFVLAYAFEGQRYVVEQRAVKTLWR